MGKYHEALRDYGKAIRLAKRRYTKTYLHSAMVNVRLKNYLRAMELRTAKTMDEDLGDSILIKTVMGKLKQTK